MIDRAELWDCLIAGTGPVGLAAAVALCDRGFRVGLIGPLPSTAGAPLDARTFALFQPTLRFLEKLGVWPLPESDVAPLATIHIIDDTGRLLRAPDTFFQAREIGHTAFGYNIPHATLVAALLARVTDLGNRVSCFNTLVEVIESGSEFIRVTLADGQALRARLLIGADGRQSTCRELARIPTRRWSYGQAAIVASIAHSRPHGFVSTELHRPAGPLTTIPLPGLTSSIVWVERPDEAKRLEMLREAIFIAELHSRLQGLLGRITALGPRQVFALEGLVATPAGRHRVALVGEALHAFPPIGAQGLNLGFRDVASLIDAIVSRAPSGADVGSDEVLEAYASDRSRDVFFRTLMVDTLDRSLTLTVPPMQLLRGGGLHLVNQLPALRKALMRRGLGPVGSLPTMMQDP